MVAGDGDPSHILSPGPASPLPSLSRVWRGWAVIGWSPATSHIDIIDNTEPRGCSGGWCEEHTGITALDHRRLTVRAKRQFYMFGSPQAGLLWVKMLECSAVLTSRRGS